jgi:hypothetical protein
MLRIREADFTYIIIGFFLKSYIIIVDSTHSEYDPVDWLFGFYLGSAQKYDPVA